MKAIKNLSLVLALALGATAAGCAAGPGDGEDGEDGNGGGNSTKPIDATGRYQVTSKFDLVQNMPGKVGEVTKAIIAMTDGGADPADWLLEQIIAKMPAGTIKNLLTGARPFVASYLNDRLLTIAPEFVTTMVQVGKDFGQAAQNFGLNETLDISGADGQYTSTMTIIGLKYTIDNVEQDVLFSANGAADVSAPSVGVTLNAGNAMTIADHKIPLQYGTVLKLSLDKVIIPAVDSSATNLQTLLVSLIDCAKVGTAINNALVSQFGIGGGATLWTGACNAGLVFGASTVYAKLDAINGSALEFNLNGIAQVGDSDGDRVIDTIPAGTWNGTLSYGGAPAPLPVSTFTGERL